MVVSNAGLGSIGDPIDELLLEASRGIYELLEILESDRSDQWETNYIQHCGFLNSVRHVPIFRPK